MTLREKVAVILGDQYCVGRGAFEQLVYPTVDRILAIPELAQALKLVPIEPHELEMKR